MANITRLTTKSGTVVYSIKMYIGRDPIKKSNVLKQIRYTPTQDIDEALQLQEVKEFAEIATVMWKKHYKETSEYKDRSHNRKQAHIEVESPDKGYKRIYEVSKLYGVSERTISRMIKDGKINAVKSGDAKVLFVEVKSLEAYLKTTFN